MAITHDDVFLTVIIIGFMAIIFAIFLAYIWTVTTCIPSSECASVQASFGVVQNANPTSLNECGPVFPSCILTGITSLNSAINKCDEDPNICIDFTYDPNLNQMIITNPNLPYSQGLSTVYTRLRGVRTLNTK